MPGILPMKVIKVGTNAQTRIAQACDRCRSKKIRCDGIRPCCSQCANVGFECKTSDKLSRRAFPRGYTESLEERVRQLESEVRELKDLLDEKDEKIDMLSRIHSRSTKPLQLHSPRQSPTSPTSPKASGEKVDAPAKDDIFQVQQSPHLNDDDRSDSYFAGTSSTRNFIDSFKDRAEECENIAGDIDTSRLLMVALPKIADSTTSLSSSTAWRAPPRLVADQLINIFFQEWAPLFPVLHRPTFLTLYERYTNDFDSVIDKAEIAQLNLVFGIAALSNGAKVFADVESFELQWKAATSTIIAHSSMATLQVLVLAQLYCIQQGDLTRLLTYKGLSTSLSARLGLHQSQKRFALGTLTCETRKKVFWTLFTLDSFTSVMLGLPKHLKDEDVHCEYPVDADDEYVSEGGFQPSLPGESTRLSGALALFRLSRVLSKVLEEVYPANTSYELSLRKLSGLSDELDAWYTSLAPHLRLQFALDKPSTGVISSRSPILSLAYHYIRALIQRPAVCASLGTRSSSSMIAMASSCKNIVQIIQLLDERGLSFSFCLNRAEVLVICGIGLLYQGISLETHSKILKDNAKTTAAIVQVLKKSGVPCASEFERVANDFTRGESNDEPGAIGFSRHNSEGAATTDFQASTRKQLKAIASRLSASIAPKPISLDGPRRASFHSVSLHPRGALTQSQPSLHPPTYPVSRSEPAQSPANMSARPNSASSRAAVQGLTAKAKRPNLLNLDYLSFGSDPDSKTATSHAQPIKPEPQPSDWERLLGNLDNGETNIFDACYGGPSVDVLLDAPPLRSHPSMSMTEARLDDDFWALCQTDVNANPSGSILSFSTDEALSSVEDFTAEWASAGSSHEDETFVNMSMPEFGHVDEATLDAVLNLS